MNTITKEIYGSSIVFYPGDRPTDTGTTLPYAESYSLDEGSVILYNNNSPKDDGSFPPSPKIFKGFRISPVWDVNDITPSSIGAYTLSFEKVWSVIFIASKKANNLTQNFFALSALDFRNANVNTPYVNSFGPGIEKTLINDFHLDYKYVVGPYESLRFKLRDATLDNNLPSNTLGNTTRYNAWTQQWGPNPVLKIHTEWEELNTSSQYYDKISLNDLDVKSEAFPTDQDITLLDLRNTSTTLLNPPFTNLFAGTSFTLKSLGTMGAYPYTGETTKFMYSVILKTEGRPESEDEFIVKYARYYASDGTTAREGDGQNVLENVVPPSIKRGQYLVLRVYAHESTVTESTKKIKTNRQFPGFWLYGTLT